MDREGGMVARRHGRGHTVRWNWNKCNLEGPKFCFLDVKDVTNITNVTRWFVVFLGKSFNKIKIKEGHVKERSFKRRL